MHLIHGNIKCISQACCWFEFSLKNHYFFCFGTLHLKTAWSSLLDPFYLYFLPPVHVLAKKRNNVV
uniref:Putative ovule protein n=1 Tax=Solanum chacoense TaxID=4108 RepID=A0A0V0HDP4_SOLCH